MQQPADNVTLSSEEVESLMAQVHQSNLPTAVAGCLEQSLRTCLWLVFALQETKITVSRLRRLLFGKAVNASEPAREDASALSRAGGDESHADAADAAATASRVPPEASQRPERAKPKGGHRGGTGRLGADAYVGAQRVECRHEE